ncbi:HET-domain-containing protein, partial [Decorospora gaudefroyi]
NPASRSITTRPIEQEVGSKAALARASQWLQTCLHETIRGKRSHSSCFKPADGYMPTRLIEVVVNDDQYELKLRETKESPTEPYCALSYCWGGEQPIKTTRVTLEKHLNHLPWEHLPRTVQDAAIVCNGLEMKYLWIDAFCIIQDDDADKANEIFAMAHVYRNASVTIAASRAASVQDGFLGERSATLSINEVYEIAYRPKKSLILGSPLDTRGWTLQERLLSPRNLVFGSRQMRFVCQHNPRGITDGWRLWPEGNSVRQDTLENSAILRAELGSVEPVSSGPELVKVLDSWDRLIQAYTHRSLSYPQDRILAIAGIAQLYRRILGDKYFAGHWRSSLSRSLYWKAKDPSRPRPKARPGPSWSWISLGGPVEFPSLSSAE